MKNILNYIGGAAILFLIVWGALRIQQDKIDQIKDVSNAKIEELEFENTRLVILSDSLLNKYAILEYDMGVLEGKADSLGKVAESLEMPCEHELELRKKENDFVRMALKKCKEAKTIQTTRVGLSEIMVANQVELRSEQIIIYKSDLKQEKRKSFFKGMGAGGLLVGILIILAL